MFRMRNLWKFNLCQRAYACYYIACLPLSLYLRFTVLAVTKHLLCSHADGKFSDKMRAHNDDWIKATENLKANFCNCLKI